MLKSKFPLSRSLGNDTGLATKRLDAKTFVHANRHAIMGQRHVNHPPIDHPYKHRPFTCFTTLQGPYPYQQIKVRSQPVANITKKHGGMQHPRPVVPTKSGHSKSDRRYKSKMRNSTTSHFSTITRQQSFL